MTSKKILKLPEIELTKQQINNLQMHNIELTLVISSIHEAITNHRLNSKCATAADIVLWKEAEFLLED